MNIRRRILSAVLLVRRQLSKVGSVAGDTSPLRPRSETSVSFTKKKLVAGALAGAAAVTMWFWMLREFLANGTRFFHDANTNFFCHNYYLNSLLRGVYPLWNPFQSWGRPEDASLRISGDMLPFLNIPLALKALGFPAAFAYKVFLILYFFFGVWGVYVLALKLLRTHWQAYLAVLIMLFSKYWHYLFSDVLSVLIAVPAIWFFYFLISFCRSGKAKDLWGLTLCLVVVMTTYIPFFFILVFLFFSGAWGLSYGLSIIKAKENKSLLPNLMGFWRKNRVVAGICLGIVIWSAVPGYLWIKSNKNYVAAWRGSEEDSFSFSPKVSGVSQIVGTSALTDTIFGHIEKSFFVVPFFVYIILSLAVILPLTRLSALLMIWIAACLFFALGNVTFLYPFLYKWLFFVKYFRNIHFFLAFIIPMAAILTAYLTGLLISRMKFSRKSAMGIWIVAIHIFWISLAFSLQEISPGFVFCIVASCLMFLLILFRAIRPMSALFLVMIFLIVVVPCLEALAPATHDWKNLRPVADSEELSVEDSRPVFRYIRPSPVEENRLEAGENYAEPWDMSGYCYHDDLFLGLRHVYDMQRDLPQENIWDNVKYKFVLYDAVCFEEDEGLLKQRVLESLTKDANCVYLAGRQRSFGSLGAAADTGHPQKILRADGPVTVTRFEVNELVLRTDLEKERYLVYNDAYHQDWRAFLDGAPVAVERANYAFKGFYIPAGKHELRLNFRRPWPEICYVGLLLTAQGLFWYLVIFYVRRDRRG